MALIEEFETRFLLGVPAMDRNHREFVELINRMAEAANPVFAYLFPEMVRHTHAHFAAEEALMRETAFKGGEEHRNMHQRVLGEMDWFGKRIPKGHLTQARVYVTEQLPSWFAEHAVTMDSALAAHVRSVAAARLTVD